MAASFADVLTSHPLTILDACDWVDIEVAFGASLDDAARTAVGHALSNYSMARVFEAEAAVLDSEAVKGSASKASKLRSFRLAASKLEKAWAALRDSETVEVVDEYDDTSDQRETPSLERTPGEESSGMSEHPSINRRRLLLGLAAASSAAAAVPALAAIPGAFSEPENPELLRLGDDLEAMRRDLAEAVTAERHIVRTEAWPEPAPEIVLDKDDRYDSDIERDVTGGARYLNRRDVPERRVGAASRYRFQASHASKVLKKNAKYMQRSKTHGPAYWRAKLDEAERAGPLACAYAEAIEEARAASVYPAAHERTAAARKALADHIASIMACREQGVEGLLIKAQAFAAFSKLHWADRILLEQERHGEWASEFAAAVIRVASEGDRLLPAA